MDAPTPLPDTIVAVATPPGRGAIGIVRLSGREAFAIGARLAGPMPVPREVALRHFVDARGERIDQGLLIAFAGPQSFTGEDVVELQAHGAPVVLDLLVRAAIDAGARAARPGEFSERAFLNGRLDLAQAEAIADLIEAASAQAARAAQRSLEGELSRRVATILTELVALRVFVEGALDFAEDGIDWLADENLHARLAALIRELERLVADAGQGRRLREGMVVTLTGRPNVGKSTLLNRFAGEDRAIVTEIAGTTRDLLREHVDLGGLPLTLVDTAGLRDTEDPIEREGVRRAREAIAQAELALYVVDDREGPTLADHELLSRLPVGRESMIVVHNKCDLSGRPPQRFEEEGQVHVRIAALAGDGLDLLGAEIRRRAGLDAGTEGLFSARTRHLAALQRTLAFVRTAARRVEERAGPELAAEELALAQHALSEITGAFTTEDLLGEIFGTFCIGK